MPKFLTKEEKEKKAEQLRLKKEREQQKKLEEAHQRELVSEAQEREGMKIVDEEAKALIRKQQVLQEERIRLSSEKAKRDSDHSKAKEKYERWTEKTKSASEWRHFLDYAGKIDASKLGDINTFMSTWSDDPNNAVLPLSKVVELAQTARDITTDIEALEVSTESMKEVQRYQEAMNSLREFVFNAISATTADLVHHADMHMAQDSEVCLLQEGSDDIKIGIWATFGVSPNTIGNPGHIDFEKFGMGVDVPAFMALRASAVRLLYTSLVNSSSTSQSSQTVYPIGGEFTFEVLQMPPAPVKVKTWTLRQVSSNSRSLTVIPYSPPAATQQSSDGATQVTPTLPLHFTVPSNVLVREPPLIGRWNLQTKTWETSVIANVVFDQATRIIRFMAPSTGVYSLVQSVNLDIPFESWEMLSDDADHATLTLRTHSSLCVSIHISDGACTLISPDVKELKHLRDSPLPPLLFLQRLERAGIRLLAGESSGSSTKKSETEQFAHRVISDAAGVANFSWSKWNSTLPSTAAVILASPRANEASWRTVLVTEHCCEVISVTEQSESFSDIPLDNSLTHLGIRECLLPSTTHLPELQLCQTVQSLLNLIRPLSFSS